MVYRPAAAALTTGITIWLAGLGSVFSFNWIADWHPLERVPILAGKTLFETVDFVAGNLLLPLGALLNCLFIGWRLDRATFVAELSGSPAPVVGVCRILLRFVCPIAIAAVLLAALLQGHAR